MPCRQGVLHVDSVTYFAQSLPKQRKAVLASGNPTGLDAKMLEKQAFPIAEIYVPTARVKTLDPTKVEALAEDILENGQTTPIRVRAGKGRYVLQEGMHRLEAMKALGEDMIEGYLAHARLH